jgi:serine protease
MTPSSRTRWVVAGFLAPLLFFGFFLWHPGVNAQQKPGLSSGSTAGSTSQYLLNRVIVRYRSGGSTPELTTHVQLRQARSLTLFGQLQNTEEDVVNRLLNRPSPEQQLSTRQIFLSSVGATAEKSLIPALSPSADPISRWYVAQTNGSQSVTQIINRYRSQPDVEYAQPDYLYHPQTTTPNDPMFSQQWALTNMSLPKAWDITKGSPDVKVAVIDTGVDTTNPDLVKTTFTGARDYAMCDDEDIWGNCSVPKDCPQKANGYCRDTQTDTGGHGTHVTGSIAASTNNAVGIAGVDWSVTVIPIQVANAKGQMYEDWLLPAVQYAADQGARAINLSLGYDGSCSSDQAMQDAVTSAGSHGTSVVAAAGNTNSDAQSFTPASCNGVISVGATGRNNEKASYSNYGSSLTLSAPGGNPIQTEPKCWNNKGYPSSYCSILSTFPYYISDDGCTNSYYCVLQGTSMAAPHVTGVIGLMYAVKPSLSPTEVKSILANSAYLDPVANPDPAAPMGAGVINADKILVYISGGVIPTSSPTAPPTPTSTVKPASPTPTATTKPTTSPSSGSPTPAVTPNVTPPPNWKPGDANGDGQVNEKDYTIWNSHYLKNTTNGYKDGDFNADGVVDGKDYAIWVMNFGS